MTASFDQHEKSEPLPSLTDNRYNSVKSNDVVDSNISKTELEQLVELVKSSTAQACQCNP